MAAVSLSWGGPGAFPEIYLSGKRQLEDSLGLVVVEGRHARAAPAWLAAHPEERAADLMAAFADPAIKGIVSTIGGDDSIRLLPFLDLAVIRDHPKVFLGFSDTTVTHFACLKAGLVSFYGPAIIPNFAELGGPLAYTTSSVRQALFSTEPAGRIVPNSDGWTCDAFDWADPGLRMR